jgi:carboxypeptidase C (cathepsin A)
VTTEEEALSVTHHTAEVDGQTLAYTTTVGRLPVSMGDQQCQMFFTAYTLDGVEDVTQRPITFAFNGGPGSSSEWLHLGMLAPRKVEMDQDGQPTQLPVKIVDNPYSVLDMTDLVFIDPVGTGYSRVAEGSDPRVCF